MKSPEEIENQVNGILAQMDGFSNEDAIALMNVLTAKMCCAVSLSLTGTHDSAKILNSESHRMAGELIDSMIEEQGNVH